MAAAARTRATHESAAPALTAAIRAVPFAAVLVLAVAMTLALRLTLAMGPLFVLLTLLVATVSLFVPLAATVLAPRSLTLRAIRVVTARLTPRFSRLFTSWCCECFGI